ncbi:Presilphiperfolan-8-beta-ol synthase [Rostrohypoxylon terebratum]|nr:Presilphiperfolan-8-beta-ol synthase [Rostrohypoxylon terebratum]
MPETLPLKPECSSTTRPIDTPMAEISHDVPPVSQGIGRPFVRLPDLFSSIMSSKLVVNPNYFKVKPEGERWIARVMNMDERTQVKNREADLCYISAIWAPDADEDALRFILDWNHWVFLFDDQFDEGHLKDDLIAAKEELDQTMAIMEDGAQLISPEDSKLRHIFQTLWLRYKQSASIEYQQRFKKTHKMFFGRLLAQVQLMTRGEVLSRDVETYMELRRGTIGAYVAIVLSAWAQGCEIPENVFSHNSTKECMRISTDLTILVNDLLSYRRDQELGVEHNLITLLMAKGMSIQQAVDEIGVMVDNRYKQWYTNLAELPPYGEKVDRQVLMFIETCRQSAFGNLHWSFKTGRYLGPEGQDVHDTQIMYLSR